MIQNKQENRLGGGSVAAIAVVALMVLCPLAMSDFSDANEIPDDIETMSGTQFVQAVLDADGTYDMTKDIYLT